MVNPLLWLPIEEAWFDLRQLFAIQVQYFREELFGSFARTTPTAIIVNVQQAPRNKPAVSGLADGSRAYTGQTKVALLNVCYTEPFPRRILADVRWCSQTS